MSGRDDLDIQAECAAQRLEPPFSDSFLNVGHLWGLLTGSSKSVGLCQALGSLGMAFEGTRHRACPDAVNAARVLIAVTAMVRRNLVRPMPDGAGDIRGPAL